VVVLPDAMLLHAMLLHAMLLSLILFDRMACRCAYFPADGEHWQWQFEAA
jgi:hypothetical protein